MAKKRMFTNDITTSDAFVDMPLSAQALYFHLAMGADDDGFNDRPRQIMRIIGANKNDMDILMAKRFILFFNETVCVIKHWKMHNTIRKDRYTATNYTKYLEQLQLNPNNAYALLKEGGNQMATKRQPNDNHLATKWQPNGNPDEDKDLDIDIEKNDKASPGDDVIIFEKSFLTDELIKRKFIKEDALEIKKYDELFEDIKNEGLFDSLENLAIAISYTIERFRGSEITNVYAWFEKALKNNLRVISALPEKNGQLNKQPNTERLDLAEADLDIWEKLKKL